MRTYHSLMDKVFDPKNLSRALRHGRRRGGGPGPDGITWGRYCRDRADRLRDLRLRLREGRYAFRLPAQLPHRTHTGKMLDIFIWPVEDRIVQIAIGQVLRRTVMACPREGAAGKPPTLEAWLSARDPRTPVMFAVDVKDWFASTDVERALLSLRGRVSDGCFLRLVRQALHVPDREGLASGNPLSQVMADWYIDTRKAHPLEPPIYRWYDSFGGGADSYESALEAVSRIEASLTPLGLRLNPRKTLIRRSRDLVACLGDFGYNMD